MPPLNSKKADGPGTLRKDVEWAQKDADDQVATGIVMVPDKVDLQADFIREDQLRAFADQFENFEEVGEAGGGVMHAVWPDDHISLERNEVLEEPETIGGETAPAGAWIQSWSFDHEELWGLVADGILAGYSVGIDSVRWDGPYEQDSDAVDDVDVPPEIDDGELVWQIVDGIMREVSAVDIPAVPDAQILDKAATEKRLAEHLGNRDAFLAEAQERGHSEPEAERLWEYLNTAVDIEGAGEPGEKTWFDRAKAFFTPGGPGAPDESEPAEKAGRTLSQANQESAMAAVDANLDLLEDAGVEHGMTRFTDQDSVDFDLSEHDAREWADDHGDGEEDEENGDISFAAGGDTPDDDTSETNMSDPNDDGEKSLAEKNAEQIDELTESVEELTRAITGEEKTREIEIGGETVEVSESELKSALGVDDGGESDADVEELQSEVKALQERLDVIAEQGGGSGQIRSAATDDGDDSKLDDIGKALS